MNSTVLLVFSQHVRLNVKASFLSRLSTVTQIKSECIKELEDTQYSHPIEVNLTRNAKSVTSITLQLCSVASHLAWARVWHPKPRGSPCRLRRLRFTLGFNVHVLPITDKGEAVLCRMWFHLEQVKQCRKIDPSSVAFQTPVRNSAKS